MPLEVSIRSGVICVTRNKIAREKALCQPFGARLKTAKGYGMFPLGSFPLHKRYTIPYKINAEENEQLYLFQELSEEEIAAVYETKRAYRMSALEQKRADKLVKRQQQLAKRQQ